MSSWAKVGAKCVCVDASKATGEKIFASYGRRADSVGWGLVRGEVYTVSRVQVHPILGVIVLSFVELPPRSEDDFGYLYSRFKPIIAKTQSEDIEMFLRIASKAPSNMETTDA